MDEHVKDELCRDYGVLGGVLKIYKERWFDT